MPLPTAMCLVAVTVAAQMRMMKRMITTTKHVKDYHYKYMGDRETKNNNSNHEKQKAKVTITIMVLKVKVMNTQ